MAVKALAYVALGVLLAIGGVVAFSDAGPVSVDINVDEGAGAAAADGAASAADSNQQSADSESSQSRATTETGDQRIDTEAVEWAIHNRINEIRQERDLGRLQMDPKLREAARLHSSNMVEQDFFAHESPSGMTVEDRYEEVGRNCRVDAGESGFVSGGENIAYTWAYEGVETERGTVHHNGNETSIGQGIVENWMHSSGHRKNILQPYWGYEGIGVETVPEDGRLKVVATQNFC